MNHTIENIYENEINPELYLERRREIRSRRIEETLGGIILGVLVIVTFTIVQIAYGIW